MTATKTLPTTLPTPEELQAALDALEHPDTLLADVSWRIARVSEFDGLTPPTFEDLGRVFAWWEQAKRDIDELYSCISGVGKALGELDYVRICENRDPDAGTCLGCRQTRTRAAMDREGWIWDMAADGRFCPDCRSQGAQS